MNKAVYDYIDQNDGELLINCGVWTHNFSQTRPFLQEVGGLVSLLPLLENISKLVELENERNSQVSEDKHDGQPTSVSLVNSYLKLVTAAVSTPNLY